MVFEKFNLSGQSSMSRPMFAIAALALLTACGDGQPFFDDGIPDPDPDPDPIGCGICGDPDLPPGTAEPSATDGIFRHEDVNDNGGGFVEEVAYDAAADTFTVDNLAFDGANVYGRGVAVGTLGGYAVYEAEEITLDSITGAVIDQFDYRAIYGVSTNTTTVSGQTVPMSQFAIVRTGSYLGYGFGGFVYERNGTLTIPTSGQALYTGAYAGIRIFNNAPGLEYTRADARIAIDFDDFNTGNGVTGTLTNRQAFDINGNPILLGTGDDDLQLPNLNFEVGPGVMTDGGEISAGVQSSIRDSSGTLIVYEEGTYYGILGGPNANELVGVIVMESEDPRYTGVTAQETGGFIVYR